MITEMVVALGNGQSIKYGLFASGKMGVIDPPDPVARELTEGLSKERRRILDQILRGVEGVNRWLHRVGGDEIQVELFQADVGPIDGSGKVRIITFEVTLLGSRKFDLITSINSDKVFLSPSWTETERKEEELLRQIETRICAINNVAVRSQWRLRREQYTLLQHRTLRQVG